ncbi:proline-rich receptor-like protein kinase PERK2 [Bradysia coprophila]|uniref:proline-rich receptor-like protein kinase PERK2 n=1 Tax=Bradysia coprophila TaxID=38358 RepID=UPI00187D9875|nr:proline-rich receptor-like protein kinase PERK2 [Bradysia coprophila]
MAQAIVTTRRITVTRTTAVLVTSSGLTIASVVASSRSAAVQSSLQPTLPVSTPSALIAMPSPPAPLATTPNPSTISIPSLPTPSPSPVVSPPPHISPAIPSAASALTVYHILRELMIILGFRMIVSIFYE